jgi:quercetin dioxygenase-like cupin family protein
MASLAPNDKSGFRAPSRHITTHDDKGASKFLPDQIVSSDAIWMEFSPEIFSTMLWGTTSSPAQISDEADVKAYTSGTLKPTDIVTPNGTNMRFFDFAPGFKSQMHRTDSIDFSVVLAGTIENEVESGETRVGKPGDVFVQRGTNHLWRNPSDTEWTRMCFFVVAADPVVVNGKVLEAITTVNSSVEEK